MYWSVTLKLIYLERHVSLIKARERESEIPGERKRVYIISELLKQIIIIIKTELLFVEKRENIIHKIASRRIYLKHT